MGFKGSPPVNSASTRVFLPVGHAVKAPSSTRWRQQPSSSFSSSAVKTPNIPLEESLPVGSSASFFSVTSQAHDDLTVDLIAADVASLHLLISHSVWPQSFNKTPEYFHYVCELTPSPGSNPLQSGMFWNLGIPLCHSIHFASSHCMLCVSVRRIKPTETRHLQKAERQFWGSNTQVSRHSRSLQSTQRLDELIHRFNQPGSFV